MTPDRAETIALMALGWLVSNDDLRPIFMGATGAGLDDLRNRASDKDFLVGVLRFLTMDDAWIIAFCDSAGVGYDQPLRALHAMPGGAAPDWT